MADITAEEAERLLEGTDAEHECGVRPFMAGATSDGTWWVCENITGHQATRLRVAGAHPEQHARLFAAAPDLARTVISQAAEVERLTALSQDVALPRVTAPLLAQREVVERVMREHNVECVGRGEVSCLGCKDAGWMTNGHYRAHIAELVVAALSEGATDGS